jgi:hypothetical protein
LYDALGVQPHPILKLPTTEQVITALQSMETRQAHIEHLQKRQRRILLADQDPLSWGFEAQTWLDADRVLTLCSILGLFGGNRAMKTWYAIKRACQAAVAYPTNRQVILSESETASITTVQALVWFYLKPRYEHLNGKRDSIFKINYSQAGGFTDRKLVLPNGSEIYFLTYGQKPGDYEGWEYGAPGSVYTRVSDELRKAGQFVPPNIGAVADESMPLIWLTMLGRRIKFRKAKLLWPFTPVNGITASIKEMVGASAVTVESRESELLPRQNLPDVPVGHMPYIRKCVMRDSYAIYFFTKYNPFGPTPGRSYYDEVKDLCEGKTTEYIERVAYGYARDSVARAFANFGSWNIVKRSQLPAIGTNYMFTDPAGARNWATLWVRVAPGNPPSYYIYRDWPDAQTYGEWAVPPEREVSADGRKGWDGDPGPAQHGLGYGVTRYKQLFLEAERIHVSPVVIAACADEANREKVLEEHFPDPYRRRLVREALRKGGIETLRESIAVRYIDPRAGASEHIAEEGGTCIIDQFEEVQVNSNNVVTGPSMELEVASGINIEEGLTILNDLLEWNRAQPLMPVVNQPHLFVCEDCLQVRWMFENYTGRGGEKGACKDFADLARYMATAQIEHVDETRNGGRRGQGF